MTKNYCYFNGKILPIDKVKIFPDDLGILRGYGIFDVIKTCNGKLFLYDKHFERIKYSAKSYGIKLPLSKSQLKQVVKELIAKNKIKNATVRIVLTAGRSADAMHFDSSQATFYILADELKPLPNVYYQKGVKLKMISYGRNMPDIKSLNYAIAVKTVKDSQKKEKFYEILYVKNGNAQEASTSNFFIFKNDSLITPKDDILKGTIRNLVINLAKGKFKVEERDLKVDELALADEAFITATNKDIVPVVKIDDVIIGNGEVGKNTKLMMEMFKKYVKNY